MALKKRIPTRPATPTKKTTSEAPVATASKKVEVPKRKPIAPPPPLARKRPVPVKKAPAAPVVATPVEKPAPAKTVRKAKPIPPKEVKPVEQTPEVKQEVKREDHPSPEASKPITPAGSHRPEPEHRRADKPEGKRVSVEAMRLMSLEERYKLFKSLNNDSEKFVPIRSELPKQMQMTKAEALIRNIIPPVAPKTAKGATVLYCPYCVDWQVFHHHAWIGYHKCIGCTISTKDFYVAVDNKIFGKGE